MTTLSKGSLAVLATIGLAACAGPTSAAAGPTGGSAVPLGIDLGSSGSLAPAHPGNSAAINIALVGEGHERRAAEGGSYQLVHEGHAAVHATGTVNAVDAAAHKLNISHSAIPEIGWPAMTMDFPVAPSVDIKGLKPGSRVNFMIEKGANGMYEIESVKPAGDAR